MRCRDVQPRLAEFAGDALAPADHAAFGAHLASCAACRSEALALDRSLRALEAAAPCAAPDLWGAFNARLAQESTCAAISDLLPEYLAGELAGSRAWSVASHLESCATCTREAALFERAHAALDRTARSLTAPDLWPAFAARLEAQRAVSVWSRWSGAWRSLSAIPAARPAFAAGLAALVVFLLAPRFQRGPESVEAPSLQAAAPAPERIEQADVASTLPRQRVEARAPATSHPTPRRVRPARPGPERVVPRAPEVLAHAEPPPTPPPAGDDRFHGLQVAFNPDLTAPAAGAVTDTAPAARSMSGEMEQAVKNDFVEFAAVIEDIRDVATSPLEAGAHGQ